MLALSQHTEFKRKLGQVSLGFLDTAESAGSSRTRFDWVNSSDQIIVVHGPSTTDTISIRGLPPTNTQSVVFERVVIEHLSRLRYAEYELVINIGLSLDVEISSESGKFTAYNDAFGVYGTGESRSDAVSDFEQSFIEFYINITDCPEENLGASTLVFRRNLSAFATLRTNE